MQSGNEMGLGKDVSLNVDVDVDVWSSFVTSLLTLDLWCDP